MVMFRSTFLHKAIPKFGIKSAGHVFTEKNVFKLLCSIYKN